jgi:hypothetical protein
MQILHHMHMRHFGQQTQVQEIGLVVLVLDKVVVAVLELL